MVLDHSLYNANRTKDLLSTYYLNLPDQKNGGCGIPLDESLPTPDESRILNFFIPQKLAEQEPPVPMPMALDTHHFKRAEKTYDGIF